MKLWADIQRPLKMCPYKLFQMLPILSGNISQHFQIKYNYFKMQKEEK